MIEKKLALITLIKEKRDSFGILIDKYVMKQLFKICCLGVVISKASIMYVLF